MEEALATPPPEVLIINSYAPGYAWSDDIFAGVISVLRREFKDIEPIVQYLDARRFPETERDGWLLADIRHKVERRPPRLVVTVDNAAFEFMLSHRAVIAPEVPLVFGGLNRFTPELIAGHGDITGVSEETDYSGTFRLITALRPGARRVLVLSNRSPSAIESRRVFESFAPLYAHRFAFEYFDDWTNEQLFTRLGRLGPEWVALVLDVTKDAAGEDNYNNTGFYERMRREPSVPVFINSRPPGVRDVAVEPWDTIGGGLVVADLHGAEVGRLAVRVLRGEAAGSIPVVRYSPQRLEVEYTQMKRFRIPLAQLPPGTWVNNAPVDTVAINRMRIVQVVAVLVVLCVIIVVLSLNILWRRRAERALRQAEEHLRASQKLEAVGLLAGGVAHDFNNILQVIRGHAGFLREALPATAAQEREDVQTIEHAAERATQLTRQLLAFSRKQALNVGPVDPNALVNDMVKMLRRVLGEHIELRVTPLPEPCLLTADRGQLEQVILNLCLNARDAMPGGGRIGIELKRVTIEQADLGERGDLKPGPHLVLTISDTGAGMSPEVRRRIFEPFYTTKETGKGTGLGLAVVYGVVRQHEGAIRVYSEVGKGSVFRVMLPLHEGESTPAGPVPEDSAPRGRGTILLAEDDPQVRRIAERVLTGNGFRVLTAADGQEALGIIARHHAEIRLAVLDVLMPRVNGRQVYDALRARHPGIRVLFCSGYSAEMLPPGASPGEGFALLNKPFTARELLAHVHGLLNG
ncbi:MAG: response regulator [Opitutaceae bacterium]|nr:response regulator [Opitutaceae bacterium]